MKENEWVRRVRMVAETDRVLRGRYDIWNSKMTAERLDISQSQLSICRRLAAGLDRWPELGMVATKTEAYRALVARERGVDETSER